MHTHYICKRVNNQIQRMHTRKDKGRPHHHHGPEHQPSLDPYSARYRNGKVQCPMRQLIQAFSEVRPNKEWMVSLGESYSSKVDRLVGHTYVINGPAQSGKTSLVYWALRHDERETAIVVVDCAIYRTEIQFIQKLTKEVGEQLGIPGLDKRAIAQQNIKFSELNGVIRDHERPVVLLIRNAERLVEYRKQILLYNLLEWVATDIKKWVGLVFTTRLLSFVDRFQKRVRSRLNTRHIFLTRPSPNFILELLVRRVQWLCEQEREYVNGDPYRQRLYEKVLSAMKDNKKLVDSITQSQEYSQKDVVYYLTVFKYVFSCYESPLDIMRMADKDLKEDIVAKMEESYPFIFPYFPKHLLITCAFPEYLVMAVIYYIYKHQRTPFRFKTVYEVYLDFKQNLVTCEGTGSSFIYSKNVLERSAVKLQELNLIEVDSKEESIWNSEIRCCINPDEIEKTFLEIPNLPNFFLEILKA